MGITSSDITLLETVLKLNSNIKTVCELGSQNLYLPGLDYEKPPFASSWYEKKGIEYSCIDLAADNNAMKLDLAFLLNEEFAFDLVTDFGTSEHVVQALEIQTISFHEGHINSVYPIDTPTVDEIKKGFYFCWANKHNLVDLNGLMINVNPRTGNWPGHGYTYLTLSFYETLAKKMGYGLFHLKENPAMGNTASGWNIECILGKVQNIPFMSFEEFQECEQLMK